MSVLTTTPLKAVPSAAAGVTLVNGTSWAYGAWVEVLAATAAPITVAGLALGGGSYSAQWWELDLGVGAASAEVSVGTFRIYLHTSGSGGAPGLLLPVPLGGIGSGVRVAVRARSGTGSPTGPATLGLLYYETFSSDHVTSASQVLTSAPAGSGTASLTPSATPWANSAWVELLASAATGIGLLGLVHAPPTGANDGVEYDLGTGGSGAETVVSTLRDAAAVATTPATWLPGIYPVTAGTRVAVRMRKAGTDTTAHPVSVLYYTNVSGAAAAVETAQAYVWGPV